MASVFREGLRPARVKTRSEPKFADLPLEGDGFEPSVPLRNHDGFGELPETVKLVTGKVPKGRELICRETTATRANFFRLNTVAAVDSSAWGHPLAPVYP